MGGINCVVELCRNTAALHGDGDVGRVKYLDRLLVEVEESVTFEHGLGSRRCACIIRFKGPDARHVLPADVEQPDVTKKDFVTWAAPKTG